MTIRVLSSDIVNRIAAGEIIVRPASVLKELVENSLDSRATDITVSIRHGGKSFIEVRDNGVGIIKEEIPIALQRHATSKLQDDQLQSIHTFGFRGEALPSIASVSYFDMASRTQNESTGWMLKGHGGTFEVLTPIEIPLGTRVQVSNLFYNMPVRQKFLRSDTVEQLALIQAYKALALSNPSVAFTLFIQNTLRLQYHTRKTYAQRAEDVLKGTSDLFLDVSQKWSQGNVEAILGPPTYNRSQSDRVYFFVNGRNVQDKLLFSAVRRAYGDLIPKGRYPVVVLFLTLSGNQVDVNVHPAKLEVRFKDPYGISSTVEGILHRALHSGSVQFNTDLEEKLHREFSPQFSQKSSHIQKLHFFSQPSEQKLFKEFGLSDVVIPLRENVLKDEAPRQPEKLDSALGIPIAQIHNSFIITQTVDGITIIDQHAAAERLVLEDLKQQSISLQHLLLPITLTVEPETIALLEQYKDNVRKSGILFKVKGTELQITAVPAILSNDANVTVFISDIIDALMEENAHPSTDILDRIAGTIACHSAIRAGESLHTDRMKQLVDSIEKTPVAMQCNHGRPSVIHLSLKKLRTLFERNNS